MSIADGQIISRYITASPAEADAIERAHPDLVGDSARISRALFFAADPARVDELAVVEQPTAEQADEIAFVLRNDPLSDAVARLAAAHPDLAARARDEAQPTPGTYAAVVHAGLNPADGLVPVPGVDDVFGDPATAALLAGRLQRGEITAGKLRAMLAA